MCGTPLGEKRIGIESLTERQRNLNYFGGIKPEDFAYSVRSLLRMLKKKKMLEEKGSKPDRREIKELISDVGFSPEEKARKRLLNHVVNYMLHIPKK